MKDRSALAILIGAFCCLCVEIVAERKRYDNFHAYQLTPNSSEQLKFIQNFDGLRDNYIFLNDIQQIGAQINVLVAPEKVSKFQKALKESHIFYTLLHSNAQSELEYDEVANAQRGTNNYSWTQYYQLNDTYNWIRSLSEQYPAKVTLFVAGKSFEGRELLGIKISNGAGRQGIFIEGGMHAREWIGPATTTYIINQLLTSTDKEIRIIAENFDWYIVPHCNPDGYVYTHTTDRLWRKTRTPYGKCFGADPNRNWDFHWNEVGASNKTCSDTYAGPKASSEIEISTLAKYLESLRGKLLLYISFHSYSQLLLFPYGHTAELPPNYDDLKRVFNAAVAGAQRRYGTKYTGGNIYDAIYPASGSSIDWAYGTIAVKYAYVYELRPSSFNFWTGFKLPAAQIIPTAEETLDSITEMIKEIGIRKFL